MADKSQTEKIADNLTFYRKLHGLTQSELAEAIGYSNKSVSKWERGDGTPDIFILTALSEIYGITVSELIGQIDKHRETKEKTEAAEKDRKAAERAKKKALEKAKSKRKKQTVNN